MPLSKPNEQPVEKQSPGIRKVISKKPTRFQHAADTAEATADEAAAKAAEAAKEKAAVEAAAAAEAAKAAEEAAAKKAAEEAAAKKAAEEAAAKKAAEEAAAKKRPRSPFNLTLEEEQIAQGERDYARDINRLREEGRERQRNFQDALDNGD